MFGLLFAQRDPAYWRDFNSLAEHQLPAHQRAMTHNGFSEVNLLSRIWHDADCFN
ncbi:hypothetical protein [Pantoea septica]|uniref:hypothetical protein n=1 Tax=Pantoea septica TaxID=472695 RepID=UPI003D0699B8